MSELANTNRLWIASRHDTFLVLAPGLTGTPEPVEPAPLLFKAVYLTYAENIGNLDEYRAHLDDSWVTLLVRYPSPDGPPAHSAIPFLYERDENTSYVSAGRSFHGVLARLYLAAQPRRNSPWQTDIAMGRHGSFLIGQATEANLWRVGRVETDYASRYNFTIVPVVLTHGLPNVNSAIIKNDAIRREFEQHWAEFADTVTHQRYYSLLTSAKNVVECVLYYFLLQAELIPAGNRELAEMLKILNSALSGSAKKTSAVPFDFLAYHLMQKVRILHGKTHIGRVMSEGRTVSPEFALNVAGDVIEVLLSAGIAEPTQTGGKA